MWNFYNLFNVIYLTNFEIWTGFWVLVRVKLLSVCFFALKMILSTDSDSWFRKNLGWLIRIPLVRIWKIKLSGCATNQWDEAFFLSIASEGWIQPKHCCSEPWHSFLWFHRSGSRSTWKICRIQKLTSKINKCWINCTKRRIWTHRKIVSFSSLYGRISGYI